MERAEHALGEIKNLEKAIAAAPRSVGPLLERAAFFFELGWPEIALKDAEDAYALWPRTGDGPRATESRGAVLQKACALLALERRDEAEKLDVNVTRLWKKQPDVLRAIAKTDAALQASGPDATTLGRRAHHLNRLQQYALSDADTETALKLNPDCDTALAARAESLEATGSDWKALPDAKRAVELNPRNELALFLLGRIEVKHHNYAEAVAALTKLLGLQPKDREALQLRESSYRVLGRTAEAETDAAVQKTLDHK
jgi:tetratricopeptide (TPR) repeat protein